MSRVRYEVEPTAYALRVYEDDGDNYVACAQIRTYGDRGWVSSISSPKLFLILGEQCDALMDDLAAVTLEGYMSRAMARAVRVAARGKADVSVSHSGSCAGRQMDWVVLRKLQGAPA